MTSEPAAPDAGHRLMRLATYASVGVASFLIVVKLIAYQVTGSVSLLSSLLDSLLDAAASVVNLFAVRQALQPADDDHRFGHGKAEPLAGLAQSAFIGGSAVFLCLEAVDHLFNPTPVRHSGVGIAVMLLAIVLSFGLVLFQKRVIRRTGSVAISADHLHYQSDLVLNASVIVALLLSVNLGWRWADPMFALGIAAYILWGAWGIMSSSLAMLMDREMDEEDRQQVLTLARESPHVQDVHDLRTRVSGQHQFIQFHLELEPTLPLIRAHAIAEHVERRIRKTFPKAEVLIHQDPAGYREQFHSNLVYRD